MEKVVRIFLITLCVLGVTGVASAVTTSAFTPSPTISTAPFGTTYFRGAAGGSPSVDTVSWAFNWTLPVDTVGINSAQLVVNASDVDAASGGFMAEVHKVYVGSVAAANYLGDISFGESAHDTTFNITGALLGQIDGSTTFVIDLFVPASGQATFTQKTTLNSATLNMMYDFPDPPPVVIPEPDPVIPAPGAIILSSLGAGLVGWLRRRGTV